MKDDKKLKVLDSEVVSDDDGLIPEELKKVWECPQAEKFNFPSEA